MCSLDRDLGIWSSDFWLRPPFLKYWGLHFAGFEKENVNLNISGTGALIKNRYIRFVELCPRNTPAKFQTTAPSQFFRKWRRSWKTVQRYGGLKFRLPIQLSININLWGKISWEGEVRLTSRFLHLVRFFQLYNILKNQNRAFFTPRFPPLALRLLSWKNVHKEMVSTNGPSNLTLCYEFLSTHEGPKRHVSRLARKNFTHARNRRNPVLVLLALLSTKYK